MDEIPASVADEELACPLCDYSLRGLIDPRCPECGYAFDWEKLRAAIREKHQYLYEHADGIAVKRFLRTLLHGWRPGVMWKDVQAAHAINLARLRKYWAIIAGIILALILGQPYILGLFAWLNVGSAYTFGEMMIEVTQRYRWTPLSFATVFAALWPMGTMLLLGIFTESLTKARIRRSQLWRCAVYCGDVFILLPALEALALLPLSKAGYLYFGYDIALEIVVFALLWAIATFRLWVAFRIYLRMPQAAAIVLLTQFVAGLAMLTFAIAIDPRQIMWLFWMLR